MSERTSKRTKLANGRGSVHKVDDDEAYVEKRSSSATRKTSRRTGRAVQLDGESTPMSLWNGVEAPTDAIAMDKLSQVKGIQMPSPPIKVGTNLSSFPALKTSKDNVSDASESPVEIIAEPRKNGVEEHKAQESPRDSNVKPALNGSDENGQIETPPVSGNGIEHQVNGVEEATAMEIAGADEKEETAEEAGAEVRYGIVGTGMMGCEHILNLAAIPGAVLVAVADTYGPSLEAAARAAGSTWKENVQVFSDHKALLNSQLCDVVVVATPNMTHADILLDILEQEKPPHILVEKPLCTTVQDCKRVIAAAARKPGLLLQVGLEYRFMAPVARLLSEVHGGTVGRVHMVSIREHRYPFLHKVHNWNRFNENSGGTLVEKCCHFFDLMTLIAAARPVRVIATGGQAVNHLNERYDGKVPDILDHAYVIVEFDNGCRGLLDLCMFAEGSVNEQEISVVGDAGKIEALVPENIVRIGSRKDGRQGVQIEAVHDDRIRYEGLHHGASYLEHLGLIAAVRSEGNLPPAVELEEGLLSVAVGVAAHKSIALGRPVLMKEVLDCVDQDW